MAQGVVGGSESFQRVADECYDKNHGAVERGRPWPSGGKLCRTTAPCVRVSYEAWQIAFATLRLLTKERDRPTTAPPFHHAHGPKREQNVSRTCCLSRLLKTSLRPHYQLEAVLS
jgi:hypothetical protein